MYQNGSVEPKPLDEPYYKSYLIKDRCHSKILGKIETDGGGPARRIQIYEVERNWDMSLRSSLGRKKNQAEKFSTFIDEVKENTVMFALVQMTKPTF